MFLLLINFEIGKCITIIMKIAKRIFLGLIILIVLIVGAAIVIPIIYKGKLVELGKKEANKQLNANLDFDNDISITLFKSFPDISIGISKLKVVNVEPFLGDTLISAEKIDLTLDLMSVIKGEHYDIKKIALIRPKIKIHTLADGQANYNITKTDTTPTNKQLTDTSSKFKLSLKKYSIENAYIVYDDKLLGMQAKVVNMKHSGTGNFDDVVYDLITETTIEQLSFGYGGVNYLSQVKTNLNAVLNIDMGQSKYSFKENVLKINDLELGFNGFAQLKGDDITTDLKFETKKSDFKNFLSLIPTLYQSSFKDLSAKGKFGIDGNFRGTYNATEYPAFNINMLIENGSFKYASLPAGVDGVNLKANIKHNQGNLDNMTIAAILNGKMANDPFAMDLIVKQLLTDPYIDLKAKAKIVLAKFREFIPLNKSTTLDGIIDLDVAIKGTQSAAEKGNYESFNAVGTVNINQFKYADDKVSPVPINISRAGLKFNPNNLELQELNMIFGKSDINAKGYFNNYLGYALKGSPLVGKLTMNSKLMDINELLPATATETPASKVVAANQTNKQPVADVEVFSLPKNIDFTFNSTIGKILYESYIIDNFQGFIILKNEKLEILNTSLQMLGADMKLSGIFDASNSKKPELNNFKFNISHLGFQQMFAQIPMVQKYASITKNLAGSFDGEIMFSSPLAEGFMPILSQLTSNGFLKIDKAELSNYLPMKQLGEKLGISSFDKIVLTGIKPSYYISDGRINLKEPVKFNIDKANFSVIGSSGLDKTLKYTMEIVLPSTLVKNQVQSNLNATLSGTGIKVPIGETIKVLADISGTVEKPVIKLNLGQMGKDMLSGLKDQALDELNKKKKELEDEARKKIEAEKQKQLQRLDNEKAKLKNTANEKEAEARKRIEAEKARIEAEKRKVEEEAKRKAEEEKNKIKNEAKEKGKDIFKKRF